METLCLIATGIVIALVWKIRNTHDDTWRIE